MSRVIFDMTSDGRFQTKLFYVSDGQEIVKGFYPEFSDAQHVADSMGIEDDRTYVVKSRVFVTEMK